MEELGAYAAVGEDLEKETVRYVAAYNMGGLDVVFHRFKAGFDFGDHAAFYDALFGEFFDLGGVNCGDKSFGVCGVFEEAGNVGKEDELFRGKAAGYLGSCDVSVNIVGVAFLVSSYGSDDRNGAVHDGFEDPSGVYSSDFADIAPVEGISVVVSAFEFVNTDGVSVLGD